MSRDGDRRVERFVTPSTSGISSALWPTGKRRYIATDWFAQQHRFFIMKGISWSCIQKYSKYLRLFYPLLIAGLLVAGSILALLLFQYLMLLFMLAVVWSILIVFTTRFLYDKIYHIIMVRYKVHSSRSYSFSPFTKFPETPMPATPLIRVLETIDLSKMDVEQFIANEANQPAPIQIHDTPEKQGADMSP